MIYAVLVCGVLTVTAVVALSVLVGVYGKQIMDFIRKHEPEWYKENRTKTNNATSMPGDRGKYFIKDLLITL